MRKATLGLLAAAAASLAGCAGGSGHPPGGYDADPLPIAKYLGICPDPSLVPGQKNIALCTVSGAKIWVSGIPEDTASDTDEHDLFVAMGKDRKPSGCYFIGPWFDMSWNSVDNSAGHRAAKDVANKYGAGVYIGQDC